MIENRQSTTRWCTFINNNHNATTNDIVYTGKFNSSHSNMSKKYINTQLQLFIKIGRLLWKNGIFYIIPSIVQCQAVLLTYLCRRKTLPLLRLYTNRLNLWNLYMMSGRPCIIDQNKRTSEVAMSDEYGEQERTAKLSVSKQKNSFVVSGVTVDIMFLEYSTQSHEFCSIENPSNGFVRFELVIKHDPTKYTFFP